MTAWWPATVLTLLLSGCVGMVTDGTPTQTALQSDRVELPVVPAGARPDMLLVYAKVNGKGPYRFLVDTGSTSALLAPQVWRALDLRPSQHNKLILTDAGAHSVEMPSATVERLEAGGFVVKHFSAAMLDAKFTTHLSPLFGEEWGGILGMSLFTDVLLELDFVNHKVFVARHGSIDLPEAGWLPYEADLFTPFIDVQIAGRTIKAMLDTGSGSTLDVPVVTQWPLAFPPVSGVKGIHAFGVHERRFSQLDGDVRFGPVTLHNPPIFDGLSRARIGNQALNEWKLVFDQRKKRIWILGGEKTISWKPISPEAARLKTIFP